MIYYSTKLKQNNALQFNAQPDLYFDNIFFFINLIPLFHETITIKHEHNIKREKNIVKHLSAGIRS